MKFILNKDKLEIENIELVKSGSVSYYEAEVEYDESWDGLVIEAVMVHSQNNTLDDIGKSVAVINNKMYIDQNLKGTYCIGFVGYKIEEEKKVYQISTNLEKVWFDLGAGEIETENEELPTLTEWEIYIAQIQEMLNSSKISVSDLEKVLQDILEAIQKGGTTSNTIAEIEQIIVSYFENKTVEEVEG